MIYYKDMTFCASDCTNSECFRHFGPEDSKRAEQWWSGPDFPLALSDFSSNCSEYKPPKE